MGARGFKKLKALRRAECKHTTPVIRKDDKVQVMAGDDKGKIGRVLRVLVSRERVVVDGPFVTAGGVTAGIDFGLAIAAEVAGARVAQEIALELEYDPAPRFPGDPRGAEEEIRRSVERRQAPRREERRAVVDRILVKRGWR